MYPIAVLYEFEYVTLSPLYVQKCKPISPFLLFSSFLFRSQSQIRNRGRESRHFFVGCCGAVAVAAVAAAAARTPVPVLMLNR